MMKAAKQIGAAKFKEQALRLLEEVGPEGILITKHGRAVAKLIPVNSEPAQLIGSLRGKIKVCDDILSTGLKWNAQS